MKIAIGSDHAGYAVKESLKSLLAVRPGVIVEDAGCPSPESCDYPDFGEKVAAAVETGAADRGILVCTTGAGMTIAANRFPHVRAALAESPEEAATIRDHNGANVLVLAAGKTPADAIPAIVEAFLDGPDPTAERHVRRVAKLRNSEGKLPRRIGICFPQLRKILQKTLCGLGICLFHLRKALCICQIQLRKALLQLLGILHLLFTLARFLQYRRRFHRIQPVQNFQQERFCSKRISKVPFPMIRPILTQPPPPHNRKSSVHHKMVTA